MGLTQVTPAPTHYHDTHNLHGIIINDVASAFPRGGWTRKYVMITCTVLGYFTAYTSIIVIGFEKRGNFTHKYNRMFVIPMCV